MVVPLIDAQRNVDKGLASLLSEVMLTELSSSKFIVIGYSEIAAMVDNETGRESLGCDGTRCLAELGSALGARYLLHSSLGRIGTQYVLNLKLIDVDAATVKLRVTRQVDSSDETVLLQTVRAAVAELMQDSTAAPAPVVAVAESPDGNPLFLATGVGGFVLVAVGGFIGVTFGLLAQAEVKYAPIDQRYGASIVKANESATWSTVGWVAAGVGGLVGVSGFTFMMVE